MIDSETDICKYCGSKMGHNSVGQFKYCWWECCHCGHVEPKVPKEILEFHKKLFEEKK